jgi:hypothetical protein
MVILINSLSSQQPFSWSKHSKGSLLSSQEPATGPHPIKLNSVYNLTPYFCSIHGSIKIMVVIHCLYKEHNKTNFAQPNKQAGDSQEPNPIE